MHAMSESTFNRVLNQHYEELREEFAQSLAKPPFYWRFDHRPVYGPTYSDEWLDSERARKEQLRRVLEDLADEWGVDLHGECWGEY